MILILFLNTSIPFGSIRDLIVERLVKGQPRDPNRDDDFVEEINLERSDKQYQPTFEDIIDLFTIAK